MNKSDRAWAAGFWEGEGCATRKYGPTYTRLDGKSSRYRIAAFSIAQVNREPLRKFRRLVKIGTINGPYKYSGNRQPHWQWNTAGTKKGKHLYNLLKPWLSRKRKRQFQLALTGVGRIGSKPLWTK